MATNKKINLLILAGCLLGAAAQAPAQDGPKGHLFIIGGGHRSDAVMSRFIELAGGRNAPLAVIPLASGDPADAAKTQVDQLKRLGAADAEGVIFAKGEADKEENLRKIRRARGVFFTGGDQVTLVSFLAGTKMLEEIHRVYREGGVVGGTSAGAAIMSRVMLTGDDRQAKKDEESFSAIRSSAVAIAEGFGFVPENIVMDQHFLVRKRQNRLISVVLENPGLTGIGVDEATAFIVGPGGEAEVLGASLVTVFETMGAGPVTKDEPGHLAAKGITMHLLKSGDRYTLPKAAKIK